MSYTNKMNLLLPPPGTYVVAVSGGVDSIALLDKLVTSGMYQLIVAHFDHGIRPDSAGDADFVRGLAASYGLGFETRRETLGSGASEELARLRRYQFLRHVARDHRAGLVTAHHADDVIETIAINLIRGTGWRGLAVLDSDIVRPLLDVSKKEIMAYARDRELVWREDSTNASSLYLRNRVRHKLATVDEEVGRQLLALWATQVSLKAAIDHEAIGLTQGRDTQSRYQFVSIDDASADELLRAICITLTGFSPTRPQRARALLAIKTGRAGNHHRITKALHISLAVRSFTILVTDTPTPPSAPVIGSEASA